MTRICITGGPRTGKTTLAESLELRAEYAFEGHAQPQPMMRHTDDLIPMGWSEASQHVADEWLTQPGPWIIEGVAVPRALRKWREAHPGEPPPVDRIIRLTVPHEPLTKGQAAMAKGEATVWAEIEQWLLDAGVPVSLHAELRCEHPGENGMADLGPAGAGSRIGWMGVGPGEEP